MTTTVVRYCQECPYAHLEDYRWVCVEPTYHGKPAVVLAVDVRREVPQDCPLRQSHRLVMLRGDL